jgi:hypothetical protein
MPANWRRVHAPTGGAPPRPGSTPLTQGGAGPSGDAAGWEKLFTPVAPRCRYEDLVVPATTQARLDNAIGLIRTHPIWSEVWGLAAADPYGGGLTLNLQGGPGTGKSFAAEAIAERLGRWLIRVRHAEIISKYVGDTGKNIAGIFRAGERSGAVLVIDEADTFLGGRLHQPANSADRGVNDAVNAMLTGLEHYRGVVIFTTNLFSSYDAAFLRRIHEHVRFDPPDLDCRCRLWQKWLTSKMPLATDVTPERLAEATEGMSGGELLKVRRKAAVRTAVRSGAIGPVTWEDFAVAIAQEHATKEEHRGGPRVVSEALVEPARLPAEARARFDLKAKTANTNGHVPARRAEDDKGPGPW